MIRVLIADDSATARSLLAAIFATDSELQVIGQATNGAEAVELTRRLRPDIVTMDLRMPCMDGLEATKEIMIEIPTPIVIVTASRSIQDVEMSMNSLRAGALAIMAKPTGPAGPGFDEQARHLITQVKAMAQVKVVRHWRRTGSAARSRTPASHHATRARVIAIASSTGGPAALERIVTGLPPDFAVPILVVQHISAGFVKGLADLLNKSGPLHVKVAEAGEKLTKRTIYLAPDDRHLGVSTRGQIALVETPPIGGFRPSATFLFESVAQVYGAAAGAVILTGMGEDGVAGLFAVRKAGGRIFAQDEKSSVVFGMPGAAIAAGLADEVLPIDEIAASLVELVT
ncbi:MAG: chemotaxis-specific protein-glutamate methyltransferase CheB [Planctomycetes bacterium]|nr:chemotaxis-specific protein-glutamate methyltransferase CheB [Planctomycetota bacterium]